MVEYELSLIGGATGAKDELPFFFPLFFVKLCLFRVLGFMRSAHGPCYRAGLDWDGPLTR